MLEYIYIFAWVICIASQVLIDLSSKREKGLWTNFGPNSPPVLTKGYTPVCFYEVSASAYGGMFGYKEGAPGNLGAVGGEPSGGGGVPSLVCLCQTPFTQ